MASADATTSTPLEEDEFDVSYGDTRWSQIATPRELGTVSKTSTLTSTDPVPPDTSQSSSANPLSPLADRSVSTAQPKPIKLDINFKDSNRAAIKFCYDMAHRSVLSLKANSITARLHGAGARGIEAPSVSEAIVSCSTLSETQCKTNRANDSTLCAQLDVLQVSKRGAGIASARLKVRPRSLISSSSLSSLDDSTSGSPTKRQRIS